MKALVTGNMGFIGMHLVEALKDAGWEVVGFDLKVGQDIRQREYSLPEADWCFHLAALTDARSSAASGMMETNVMGTTHVLERFGENVVFASSSAVNYPTTPYAISKLTCEHLCKMYGARIVRLCNITGPGGHGVFQKFKQQEVLEIAGVGDQHRTYAPVNFAVNALMAMVSMQPGDLRILHGEDLTVMEIVAKYFPGKEWVRVPRAATDIIDGRQI